MGDGTHDELVPRRCVAVHGIDSVEQYTIAIAVGCAPDPPRIGRQRFSSSRLRGRHRRSAESYRIDDVLDSQQLCARDRNDRANWLMLTTRAAHCPTVRMLKSSGDGQRIVFARISMRAAWTKVVAKQYFPLVPGRASPCEKSVTRDRSRHKLTRLYRRLTVAGVVNVGGLTRDDPYRRHLVAVQSHAAAGCHLAVAPPCARTGGGQDGQMACGGGPDARGRLLPEPVDDEDRARFALSVRMPPADVASRHWCPAGDRVAPRHCGQNPRRGADCVGCARPWRAMRNLHEQHGSISVGRDRRIAPWRGGSVCANTCLEGNWAGWDSWTR